MTTPASGRGGSAPPRPPAAAKPQQWFTLRPWVFDVTLAGGLRAAPRPARPLPGHGCGYAPLKRHVLTHKHTDLRGRFYARVKAQHAVPASETAVREQNAALRRKLDDLRAERDGCKQAADAPARALNLLTAENDDLHRQLSRPRLRPAPVTGVGIACTRSRRPRSSSLSRRRSCASR